MNKARRYAALACSISVITFVLALHGPASAAACQQECDAMWSAGMAHCNSLDPSEQNACWQAVNAEFNHCSMGAINCEGSFSCDVYCIFSSGAFTCADWYHCEGY